MKHTPGPWKYVIRDTCREIVAPSFDPEFDGSGTLLCDEAYESWCPGKEADWQLIAFAPELLQALRAVMLAPDNMQNKEAAAALLARIGPI